MTAFEDSIAYKKGEVGENFLDQYLISIGIIPYSPTKGVAHGFAQLTQSVRTWQSSSQADRFVQRLEQFVSWYKSNNFGLLSILNYNRLFALSMLRAGVDIYSLQLLMGHADLQVLRRYLKQTEQDTWAAHVKGSPVDKLI